MYSKRRRRRFLKESKITISRVKEEQRRDPAPDADVFYVFSPLRTIDGSLKIPYLIYSSRTNGKL